MPTEIHARLADLMAKAEAAACCAAGEAELAAYERALDPAEAAALVRLAQVAANPHTRSALTHVMCFYEGADEWGPGVGRYDLYSRLRDQLDAAVAVLETTDDRP